MPGSGRSASVEPDRDDMSSASGDSGARGKGGWDEESRARVGWTPRVVQLVVARPRPGLTWYNGTKGAVVTTSRSMAAELGPDRIRVNCVNPVVGATGLLTEFMGMPDTPENRAKFTAGIPLGRFSTPDDVAYACLYLASDEAAFITGACLEVDGGRCV